MNSHFCFAYQFRNNCVFIDCVFISSLRFLFTDYNRLSSVGGETSMAEMIATLSDACEREFGFLATRLFRVFKTEESPGTLLFTNIRIFCVKKLILLSTKRLCFQVFYSHSYTHHWWSQHTESIDLSHTKKEAVTASMGLYIALSVSPYRK